jgi:hypothetical protein
MGSSDSKPSFSYFPEPHRVEGIPLNSDGSIDWERHDAERSGRGIPYSSLVRNREPIDPSRLIHGQRDSDPFGLNLTAAFSPQRANISNFARSALDEAGYQTSSDTTSSFRIPEWRTEGASSFHTVKHLREWPLDPPPSLPSGVRFEVTPHLNFKTDDKIRNQDDLRAEMKELKHRRPTSGAVDAFLSVEGPEHLAYLSHRPTFHVEPKLNTAESKIGMVAKNGTWSAEVSERSGFFYNTERPWETTHARIDFATERTFASRHKQGYTSYGFEFMNDRPSGARTTVFNIHDQTLRFKDRFMDKIDVGATASTHNGFGSCSNLNALNLQVSGSIERLWDNHSKTAISANGNIRTGNASLAGKHTLDSKTSTTTVTAQYDIKSQNIGVNGEHRREHSNTAIFANGNIRTGNASLAGKHTLDSKTSKTTVAVLYDIKSQNMGVEGEHRRKLNEYLDLAVYSEKWSGHESQSGLKIVGRNR